MSVIIRERFATVEDTAEALGVPKARMRWLIKLVDSKRAASENGRPRKRKARNAHASRKRARSRAAR